MDTRKWHARCPLDKDNRVAFSPRVMCHPSARMSKGEVLEHFNALLAIPLWKKWSRSIKTSDETSTFSFDFKRWNHCIRPSSSNKLIKHLKQEKHNPSYDIITFKGRWDMKHVRCFCFNSRNTPIHVPPPLTGEKRQDDLKFRPLDYHVRLLDHVITLQAPH